MKNTIFFDHHSTTPLDPKVLNAMMSYFTTKYGNPSSQHDMGAQALEAAENARDQVARIIGANPNNIFFTTSASEANNIVLQNFWDCILTTNSEHPSVLNTLKCSRKNQAAVKTRINKDGTLNLANIKKLIKTYSPGNPIKLISIIFCE